MADGRSPMADFNIGIGTFTRPDAVDPILNMALCDPTIPFPFLGHVGVGTVLDEVCRVGREFVSIDFHVVIELTHGLALIAYVIDHKVTLL